MNELKEAIDNISFGRVCAACVFVSVNGYSFRRAYGPQVGWANAKQQWAVANKLSEWRTKCVRIHVQWHGRSHTHVKIVCRKCELFANPIPIERDQIKWWFSWMSSNKSATRTRCVSEYTHVASSACDACDMCTVHERVCARASHSWDDAFVYRTSAYCLCAQKHKNNSRAQTYLNIWNLFNIAESVCGRLRSDSIKFYYSRLMR